MIDCEYLVLMPKSGLDEPVPKYLIPCKCPDCGRDCYVAKSWIAKTKKDNPNAEVKCLECVK